MRTLLLIVMSAGLGFAPAPFLKPKPTYAGLPDVGGVWRFDRYEHRKMRLRSLEESHGAELAGGRFSLVEARGGGASSVWEMRLNPTTSPPSFTWTMGGRLTHVGSYRLDGDKMTMVFVTVDGVGARPSDLATSPPDGWRFVLRRVKRD